MKLTNTEDTAAQTGLSRWAIRQGAINGRFPYVEIGKKRLFDVEVIEQVLRDEMMERHTCSKEQSEQLA